MHRLFASPPRPELHGYVRSFAQREVTTSEGRVVQAIPSYLEQVLEFEFGSSPILSFADGSVEAAHRISAVGLIAGKQGTISFTGRAESFAIFFEPLAFSLIFSVPSSTLSNTFCDGADLLGRQMNDLWYEMACHSSFAIRVRLAEDYILGRLRILATESPIVAAARHIFHNAGALRIDEVAASSSMSVRQFQRRFVEEVGIAPKLFSRVARFQILLDTKIKRPACSWIILAHEFGFHDQMHMIRDCQDLTGISPERLLKTFGDLRPAALMAGKEQEKKHESYIELSQAVSFRIGCGVH